MRVWYCRAVSFFFFFNDTAPTEIYTLSLHDALPILGPDGRSRRAPSTRACRPSSPAATRLSRRSEEHTSELQSHSDLVCRLLLEKKKKANYLTKTASRHSSGSSTSTAEQLRTRHDCP